MVCYTKVIMEEQNDLDQPVTKREFRRDITDVKESIDFIIQNAATKEDLMQFKSDILTGVDRVFGEVKIMRQEQTMKVARDDRQDERLGRIESHVGLAPVRN